uniref:Tubulin-folding cofactor d n=1 Tax=Encephalitozoon cuniculi TaxID=6035 RepID=M1K682_ENCCN|nr:tubulin-folding cofactor d [Encephalitozoon cuniculi]
MSQSNRAFPCTLYPHRSGSLSIWTGRRASPPSPLSPYSRVCLFQIYFPLRHKPNQCSANIAQRLTHRGFMIDLGELICLMEKANGLMGDRHRSPGSAFPTDIKYLKPIISHIDSLASKNRCGVTWWLEVLLQNPFPLKIDEENLSRMISFFLEAARTTILRRSALRCLGMVVQKADVTYYSTEEPRFYIHGTEVSSLMYYGLLSQLSSLGRRMEPVPIESNDSVAVKKMKIKIMSNSPSSGVLKSLFEMLNERDSRIGWTLCKSFLKVAKHSEPCLVISALKERCDVIFANESVWINTMTILGMMSLEGWDIGDVSPIVLKGINYTNELVSSSEMVRESALFLLWALTRGSSTMDKSLFHLVVGKALFDPSLSCRRGAAAVILEHIGRFPEAWGEELISLINFHSVKRLSSCSRAVKRVLKILDCEDVFEDILLKNLFHYSPETKFQGGYCISRYLKGGRLVPYIDSIDLKTPSDFIGVFTVAREFIGQDRGHEIKGIVEMIIKLRIPPSFSRYRDFGVFAGSYLGVVEGLKDIEDRDIVCENLHMLLAKNVLPDEVSRVSWRFVDADEGFAARVARSISRGTESLILANSRNERHRDHAEKKYLELLESGNIDAKAHVMKAIRLSGRIEQYREHILNGLENYYADSRGDVSSGLRRESLMASFLMKDTLVSPRYFVRYFVDKSKVLRDECILLCKNSGVFPEGFEYIRRRGHSVDPNRLQPLLAFLNSFYAEFKRLEEESKLGNDKAMFVASIAASKNLSAEHQEEFVRGMLGTIGSSDASLCSFIVEAVFEARERFCRPVMAVLNQSSESYGRIVCPAIELICGVIGLEIESNLLVFGSNAGIADRLALALQEKNIPGRVSSYARNVLEKLSQLSGSSKVG